MHGACVTLSEVATTREELARLLATTESPPDDDRKLLAMRRGAGLFKGIAADLGVSARTVQQRLAWIMALLARELGHERHLGSGSAEA